VYLRRTPKGRELLRRVMLVRDDRVIYRNRGNRQGACSVKTFIKWADGQRRFKPKAGPLV
jgi:hypothetical protein